MPAPRSSPKGERQIHGQGGKQQQVRPKRRTCQQDFSDYEQYMSLNELPVLTKQGVSCALRDYTDQIQHRPGEPYRGTASSCLQSQGNAADLPPPYVERIENDSVARKASPVPSDRERAAVKENQAGMYDGDRGTDDGRP
ncbi:hypothetical protein QFC20_002911 [Naganishia adeliensis]|uniref:Uncharacterized protein n=1 Tax=Naganishia adeliensis TaxID=92952 RepID=A0ACC2WHM3_9TREE|nr:hypothetical protein QFC20_002911 [Naganishia adeliensis]